ncbi:low molecular weight phosphotyrosine protein phosphatase-like [Ornithodoros turicata]|uniref:low molecular weight phosphotyrosine protein phosphatase-like n=1 Tax=Ornithodoros turicata TaxID=34597 RepID=UPI003139FF97
MRCSSESRQTFAMAAPKKAALFVCLGNICRSPIAEAVFLHVAKENGVEDKWRADSAGTGDWHVGCPPDRRAQECMKAHNVHMEHRARVVVDEDFHQFDFIFGMDENNIRDLKEMAPKQCKAQVGLLGSYDPEGQEIIRDPYYDRGSDGFEQVYQQCVRCCKAFFKGQ